MWWNFCIFTFALFQLMYQLVQINAMMIFYLFRLLFFSLLVAQYCNSFFLIICSVFQTTHFYQTFLFYSLYYSSGWVLFFFALYLYQQPYSLRCDLQLLETLSIFSPFITLQKLFTECFLLSLCRSSMLRCLIVVDFWN